MVVVQFQSHVQLFCDPMDYSPPRSSGHRISQARMLEWVALSFFRGSSRPRDQTCVSHIGRQILYHWATREAHQSLQAYIQGQVGPVNHQLYDNWRVCSLTSLSLCFFISKMGIIAESLSRTKSEGFNVIMQEAGTE